MGKPLSPPETLQAAIQAAVGKANSSFGKLVVLGILAGAFIAFGAEGSNMAAFNLLSDPSTYGLGRLIAGMIFSCGLMLVILAGGELFTGDMLMVTALLDRKIRFAQFLKVICVAYVANMVGGILIAVLIYDSGLLASGGGLLGGLTIKIAAGKATLPFMRALILGILCNWLVCLAVWLAFGADSTIGKIFGIFFPITLFVTSGFEHSVANMYYIPAGILAKSNPDFVAMSGLTEEALDALNWQGFFVTNLIPVTLGNMIGGILFVAMAYYFAYAPKEKA